MPLLVYSYPDFTPNTVILSARVNAKYDDIKTLLNVTKLDDDNIQDVGITRATKLKTGTADAILVNDGSGVMSELTILDTARGGLGAAFSPTGADAGKAFQIDGSGNVVLQPPSSSPGTNIFNSLHFI